MASELASHWKTSRLGEVADVSWGDTSVTKAAYIPAGFPAYSASGPDGFLPYADFDRVGVVVSAIGADCGKTWLAKGRWSCIKNTIRLWSTDPQVDSAFLYWRLRDPAVWPKRGSAQPFISQGDARALEVTYPPLPEQRAIAHILGTLDDKIELNRRMNETLEAIARALFKSWFVDFDPVRAKTEGRDTGLPAHLADLFPDSFEDSELGKIPKGWRVKKLGDLLALAYGKALKAHARHDGNVPVYGSNGQIGWHDKRLVAGPGIIVGRKGNPGIATWAPTDFFPIDTTFYVVPTSSGQSIQFLFHVLRNQDLGTLGADSAVPGLNRNLAYMSDQVLPPSQLLGTFERLASGLSRRVNHATQETRTLAALRDTLLPKLISGELSVAHAEPILKAAL